MFFNVQSLVLFTLLLTLNIFLTLFLRLLFTTCQNKGYGFLPSVFMDWSMFIHCSCSIQFTHFLLTFLSQVSFVLSFRLCFFPSSNSRIHLSGIVSRSFSNGGRSFSKIRERWLLLSESSSFNQSDERQLFRCRELHRRVALEPLGARTTSRQV